MPSVKIIRKGKDPKQFLQEVNGKIHFEFQARLVELGEKAATTMKDVLKASGYNLNELSDNIDSEFQNIIAGIEVRIGNISKFPIGKNGNTYWEAFNDGFQAGASDTFVPLGSFGGEAPNSSLSGGKWNVGQGTFTFFDKNNNKKVVEPLRYVDIAADELEIAVLAAIKEFSKEVDSAAR
jgi:hypothetical protein